MATVNSVKSASSSTTMSNIDRNYDVFSCEKRHPVACKYFRDFQKCIVPYCAFSHQIYDNEKDMSDKLKRVGFMGNQGNYKFAFCNLGLGR